MNHIITFE